MVTLYTSHIVQGLVLCREAREVGRGWDAGQWAVRRIAVESAGR